MSVSYHRKYFRSVENSPNGEVTGQTLFLYREVPGPGSSPAPDSSSAPAEAAAGTPSVVWATYRGGSIRWGTLTGIKKPDGSLSFCYQHVNSDGELRTGCCESSPRVLDSGLIELDERWRWTNGDGSSGASVVREFIPRKEEVAGL